MRAVCIAVVTFAAVACSSGESADTGSSSDEINGGLPAKNSAGVGLLVSSTGSLCSGTLVAPRWVLTAGHCAGAITDFYTGNGSASPDGSGLESVLATMARHPTRTGGVAHPNYVYNPYVCPAAGPDVALVELETPITDIAPVAIAPLPPAGPVWCQPVGFGMHATPEGATVGERRFTTESVTAISESTISTRRVRGDWLYGMSAPGDSGGPLFCHVTRTANGVVPPPPSGEPRDGLSAVTSCGATESEGVYALVMPAMDWIREATNGEVR